MAEVFTGLGNALSAFINLGWFTTIVVWTLVILGGVFIVKKVVQGVKAIRNRKR